MSLTELKLQAQQLGLSKEKVAQFGDLRKKATWELAIAVTISQIEFDPKSASMLKSASEGTGVSEIFMDGKPENSCMDAENAIADERLVNIPVSFGKTLEQLLSGRKTVTRRLWKDDYANQFIKRFSEGRTVYPAFDKDRRYGGKRVGTIQLTCSPYKERLGDMPESDLAKEGFPELTRQEFISRFFGGDSNLEVWVIRFEFSPVVIVEVEAPESALIDFENSTIGVIVEVTEEDIESGIKFEPLADESEFGSEIILTLFGLALKVNDEHGKRCFLRNEFVKLDDELVAQTTGIFTDNLVEIQLKTREIFSVTPSRLRHL